MPPEIPQNGGFMTVAYTLTAAILVSYALTLWSRWRRMSKE